MYSIVATTFTGAHFVSEPMFSLEEADAQLESYKDTIGYFGGGFVTGYQLEENESDCRVLFNNKVHGNPPLKIYDDDIISDEDDED